MEADTDLEQLISTKISEVHLVNLAGDDPSDSSGSEGFEDEDYKPLLSYSEPKRGPRRGKPPSLYKRLATINWKKYHYGCYRCF